MKVSVCEQRLWQLSQESLQQCRRIIGVKVPEVQAEISPTVEELLQCLLSDTIPRNPEQSFNMQI